MPCRSNPVEITHQDCYFSTPNVSVGRSRSGFYFRPTSPGLFWYFFGTCSHLPLSRDGLFSYSLPPPRQFPPRKKNRTNQSLLLMEQLVVFAGQFSSHHFRPVFFHRLTVVDFFRRLPHFIGLFSLHPLTQRKKLNGSELSILTQIIQ